MDNVGLAARHIALREKAGLTQEEEAKKAGVSPTTISGIESGKVTRPHLKTVLKLADALGVGPDKLIRDQVPTEIVLELQVSRRNLEVLEDYLSREEPPDEADADRAMFELHERMPSLTEAMTRLSDAERGLYMEEIGAMLLSQMRMADRLGPWNRKHYAHLREDSA